MLFFSLGFAKCGETIVGKIINSIIVWMILNKKYFIYYDFKRSIEVIGKL